MKIKQFLPEGGRFYRKRTEDGPLVPVTNPDRPPDLWICRRVADFPAARVPEGGEVAACTRCSAPIVFNPRRPFTTPKVCMQCANIEPVPMEPPQ